MGHKESKFLLGLTFVACAIVVPLANGVNHLTQSPIHVADGNPGPPLPPPTTVEDQTSTDQILIADGNPGPPLPPPTEPV